MSGAGWSTAQTPTAFAPQAFNWCDHPPWVIASSDFNLLPSALSLAGVRQSNRHFFTLLDTLTTAQERGEAFHDYLCVRFGLHRWNEHHGLARNSLRNSYIRFLRGWQMDSNSIEGAVVKSWVQSRFGIVPTYHGGRLVMSGGEEDIRFALDRMKGSAKGNAIFSQLDLLYEFCQYELARRFPGQDTLVLYRGTNDAGEHPVVAKRDRRTVCVRLNNVVSFTADRERAWEFGSTVWQTTVALAKVICFSGLLQGSLMKGEMEYLAVGGDYWVRQLMY